MLAIILAAGESKRFGEAGLAIPKYLLRTPSGRSIMETQIDLLRDAGHKVLFVGRQMDKRSVAGTILRILYRDRTPLPFMHTWLDEKSNGPLHTAWEARSWFDKPEPVLFVYCDVLFTPELLTEFVQQVKDYDAALVAFESNDKRFSKVPDTDWAVSGIFYFKNGRDLVRRIRFSPKGADNGLPDMVFSYDDSIAALRHDVVDLGIPQDYRNWMAENGRPVQDWK